MKLAFCRSSSCIPVVTLVLTALLASDETALAADSVNPGTLETYSTMHSIGVEWNVLDDDNLDADGSIEYRTFGASQWQDGLKLFRIQFDGFNMVAGSLFFLTPGMEYEVRVNLFDPDGGGTSTTEIIKTQSIPSQPAGGPQYHVIPGSGGGTGTLLDPFRGLAATRPVADPGTTFLLHQGTYTQSTLDQAGFNNSYIVYKGAGDGEAVFNEIVVAADFIWLEDLTIRDQSSGLSTRNSPEHVVVQYCLFENNHYSVDLRSGGRAWYISDNTIVGDTPYETGSLGGEGIELGHTSDHTVAHNSITNTADGISYPHTNVDIFGNDIFNTSDDGIEADSGRANVRMWGNRLTNTRHNGITFQDQRGAPWYIIGNQLANWDQGGFKFRITDQFVIVNNTFINWNQVVDHWSQNILNAYSRNNLFISLSGNNNKGDASIFGMRNPGHGYPDVTLNRLSDLDYDGFDWGSGSSPPFTYFGQTYNNIAALYSGLGIEEHGIRINKDGCLNDLSKFPGANPALVSLPLNSSLKSGCAAIDAGVVVPNISNSFSGSAPDLGATEFGLALPHYGPRSRTSTRPNAPTDLDVL